MQKYLIILLVCIGIFPLACGDRNKHAETDLAQKIIIADTHIDLPFRLKRQWEDLMHRSGGNFDYPRARKGGLILAFMAVYIPAESSSGRDNKALADSLIDLVVRMTTTWPDSFALVTSVDEAKAQFGSRKISLAIGMENGTGLQGDLGNIRHFYDRGVRYITLAHSKSNRICDSSYDPERKWNGLSPFGRKVVAEMTRVGMMVDLAHVSDSTFYQVLRISKAPVIVSHSSCRYFTPGSERNVSDDMIRAVAANGGVIQVNFGSSFINDAYRRNFEPMWSYLDEHHMRYGDPAADAFMGQYKKEHPVPFADVSEVADHIDHIVKLVGIDHVGFGSDFDGLGDTLPTGLKDVSMYPNLIRVLTDRGYTDDELALIAAGNLFRVWGQVDRLAGQAE